MSQVLTVPTHFNDLGELSEGFLDRVEEDTLILYGPVAYEDGSEIEFAVLLADGSPALEGVGRVRAAVDGGAERVPETRYDVVVEALELDGRSEVVFERLVLARQAVSERPPADKAEPPTGDMDAAPGDDDRVVNEAAPYIDDIELTADEVFSLPPDEAQSVAPENDEPVTVPPDEEAPDTVPPEASDDEDEDDGEYDDEPATVIAAVDAEAMMAEAEGLSATEAAPDTVPPEASEPVAASESVPASEPAPELEFGEEDDVVLEATMSDASDWDEESEVGADANDEPASAEEAVAGDEPASAEEAVAGDEPAPAQDADEEEGELDSEYAFEHGIAAEPQVGMPVPVPSMAAPPEAPPAPPTLRLAEPPDGLTRPSLAQAEESLFAVDGEVSDVHTTGLFVYENGLPIPSRPPLPDPNRPASVRPVEAVEGYDVEDSEPPETDDDDYEEVRLSDFAEAAEEG